MPPAFAGYHSSGLPFGTPFTPVLGRSPGTFGFTSISPGADQNASTSSLGAGTSGEAQEDLEDQVRALRQENACLQSSVDKLKKEKKTWKQRQADSKFQQVGGNRRRKGAAMVGSNCAEKYRSLALSAYDIVAKTEAAKDGRHTFGKRKLLAFIFGFVQELYGGEAMAVFERHFQKQTAFSADAIAEEMDVGSGSLNLTAYEQVRKCDPFYSRHAQTALPSRGKIQHRQRIIEAAAAAEIGVEQNGEVSSFQYDRALQVWYDDFCDPKLEGYNTTPEGLASMAEGTGSQNFIDIKLTGDGAPTESSCSYTAFGSCIADHRLPHCRGHGLQSPLNYTPMSQMFVHEKEEVAKEEGKKFMTAAREFFEKRPVNCYFVWDMSYGWSVLGCGGSSQNGHFCNYCNVHAATKGQGEAGGCTACRALGAEAADRCMHRAICTVEELQRQVDQARVLKEEVGEIPLHVMPVFGDLDGLNDALRARGQPRKGNMETKQKALREYCQGHVSDTYDPANPMHIDRATIENVKVELTARSMPVPLADQQCRVDLRARLRKERTLSALLFQLKCHNFDEDKLAIVGGKIDRVLPCVMHAECRMHESVLTSLFQQCLTLVTAKSSKGAALDRMNRAVKHIRAYALGGSTVWNYSLEKDDASKVAGFSFTRSRAHRIINSKAHHSGFVTALVDILLEGTAIHDTVKTFFDNYVPAVALVTKTPPKCRRYTAGEPGKMQAHADVAMRAYVQWNGRGDDGISNYLHLLASGHFKELMQKHGPLGRFSNQGVEGFNKVVKQRHFRHSQRGGHFGRGASSGTSTKIAPLANWLLRRWYWAAHKAAAVLAAHQPKKRGRKRKAAAVAPSSDASSSDDSDSDAAFDSDCCSATGSDSDADSDIEASSGSDDDEVTDLTAKN
jgi:hypothetical protein